MIKDGLRTSAGFAVLFVLIAATALLMARGGGGWFLLGYGIMAALWCGGVLLVAMRYDRRPGVPIPRGAVLLASAMFVPMLAWPALGAPWYLAVAGDRVETTVERTGDYDAASGSTVNSIHAAGVGQVQPPCGELPSAGDRIVVWTDPNGWVSPAPASCTGYALASGIAAGTYVLMAGGAVTLRLSTLAKGDAPQSPLRLGSTIGPLAQWARRRS